MTFNDQVWGIPEFNSIQITMANQDLLAAAGMDIGAVNGSDWDATTSASTALAEETEGGIGYDSKLPEFLPLWAHANGVDLLSEDGRTARVNDPAVVEALDWADGIYDDQGGFAKVKGIRDSADFFGEGNQFATASLGAMPMEQWYVNVLNDVSPGAPMAFDTVRTVAGDPVAYASGSAWAIPAGANTAPAACRFMKVMTQTDTWVEAAQARVDLRAESGQLFTGVLTGNAAADDQIREMVPTDAPEPWASAIESMYEANDHAFSFPANPADAQFKTAWQDGVNRVLNGQQEPQEALDQAQQEAQKALDEAWANWDEDSDGR